MTTLRLARVTLSDRASAGVYPDASGPEIERLIGALWPEAKIEWHRVLLTDDQPQIEAALKRLADEARCDLIITTGGTGPAPRDVTPEATRAVVEKELSGFGEILRLRTFEQAPTSILSRATAGVRGRTLIVNLPGKPGAMAECLPILAPALRKALEVLGN